MLYSPQQFQRDQLVADLLAVRQRLQQGWTKGQWQGHNGGSCLVASAQLVTDQPVGMTHVPACTTCQQQVRLGRALVAIYMALYGPKAPRDVTLREVMRKIVVFNDHASSTKASVLLLLDRAVQYVQQQAGATVTAQA